MAWDGVCLFELCNVVLLVLVVQRRHIAQLYMSYMGLGFGICIGTLAYMVDLAYLWGLL